APDRSDWAGASMDEGDAGGSTADREVITTGHVDITVEDAREAAREVTQRVERVGGRVDSRHEQGSENPGSSWAELVVRIPAAELTGVLESFEDLGTVESVSQEGQDVTERVRDIEARIGALEVSL